MSERLDKLESRIAQVPQLQDLRKREILLGTYARKIESHQARAREAIDALSVFQAVFRDVDLADVEVVADSSRNKAKKLFDRVEKDQGSLFSQSGEEAFIRLGESIDQMYTSTKRKWTNCLGLEIRRLREFLSILELLDPAAFRLATLKKQGTCLK